MIAFMKNIFLPIAIVLLSSGVLLSQDPYFSQYFTSPMTLNPALIGKGSSATRVMATHRTQWWGSIGSAFVTSSISAEMPIATKKNQNNQLAIGLMGLTDASNAGLLKNNYFSVGVAYNLALNKAGTQTFGAGLVGTYGNRLLDQSKFLFQSQFSSFGFIRSINANDPIQLPRRSYFDVAAGVHYRSVGKKWDINLGASAYHIAQPDISAYESSSFFLRARLNLQAGLTRKITGGDELHFSSLFTKYGNTNVLTYGGIYKYKIQGNHPIKSVNAGVFHRVDDSFVAYSALEGQRWAVGFTYDFIHSAVRTYYNSVQSTEISFCYFVRSKKKPVFAPQQKFYY